MGRAGEHDHELAIQCREAKDQAAVISILFHTKRMLEQVRRAGLGQGWAAG